MKNFHRYSHFQKTDGFVSAKTEFREAAIEVANRRKIAEEKQKALKTEKRLENKEKKRIKLENKLKLKSPKVI